MINYDDRINQGIKMFKKYWFYYLGIFILMITLFVLGVVKMDKYWIEKTKDYPKLDRNEALNGFIINFFDSQGQCYIQLDDSSKYWLEWSSNYIYKPSMLYDFLKVGDSLVKERGIDTLYIYQEGKEYYFVLGKFINEDKEKNKKILR